MNDVFESLNQSLRSLVGQPVVLDTADTIVFLGILRDVTPYGFILENADVHDTREGHAGKEHYVHESKMDGIRTNRRRVYVMGSKVISISALHDVVQEDLDNRSDQTR